MRIEVLCEDKSSVPVLRELLAAELDQRPSGQDHRIYYHPHRGLGFLPADLQARPLASQTGLYDLLPAKLRAYQSLAPDLKMLIVVVHDSDDKNPDTCYQQLEYLFRRLSPDHYFVIGIAVEELESWLMGDFVAIQQAYPQADRERWSRYQQDSICGTWEQLAFVLEGRKKAQQLIRLGYPAVGIYKSEWAQRIAPFMDAQRNRSPSLQLFLKRFNAILSRAEGDSRRASQG
ncbi:MAG: hypothetical protein SPK23_02280 [Eubacteriales bacterium]|nr:hypothetical protein [Clostridiales bacterium]MDY5835942.1 hypothetical protein [Eubacteriales bacterium]